MTDYVQPLDASTLKLQRLLPGPIERLWTYLTDSEKRGLWFASGAWDLRPGGAMELTFDHDRISDEPYPEAYRKYKGWHYQGLVQRCEPPHLIVFTWEEGDGRPDSEVTFRLEPRGSDVLLTITHRQVQDRESMVNYASGWHGHVAILASLLAAKKPPPFWTTHAALEQQYEKRIPR